MKGENKKLFDNAAEGIVEDTVVKDVEDSVLDELGGLRFQSFRLHVG